MSSDAPLRLCALPPHVAPRYAGLWRDAQGCVVGSQGLLLLHGRQRLHAFLAAFSHLADLAHGVQLEAHPGNLFLVMLHSPGEWGFRGGLRPPLAPPLAAQSSGGGLRPPLAPPLAAAHAALVAARLTLARARLFVGDGQIFVPYADPAAPYGYDVEGVPCASERLILQPDDPPLPLPPRPADLLEALLQVALVGGQTEHFIGKPQVSYRDATDGPHPPTPSPTLWERGRRRRDSWLSNAVLAESIALLTDRRIAPLIVGYLLRHGLRYAVRWLTWQQAEQYHEDTTDQLQPIVGARRRRAPTVGEAALFDLAASDEDQAVPDFVCDFLRRLPHTTLLADALEAASLTHEPARRVLLPLDQQTPLYLPHVQELLPPHCLLIHGGPAWGYALLANPAPRTRMHEISRARLSAPASVKLSAPPAAPFQLPLALYADGPRHGPIHGLLLDAAALIRLQRMVCRLPAPLFAQCQIAIGDGAALLLATMGEVSGLPLGQALVRANPDHLLLPRGMRLRPTLPAELLVPALGLDAAQITVLTPTGRYEVEQKAFVPLSNLLALDAAPPTQSIRMRAIPMPAVDLSGIEMRPNQPQPPVVVAPPPSATQAKRGILERLRPVLPNISPFSGDFASELRRRAAELEQQGDYELAAAFYSYLKDDQRAAVCYQRLLVE
ncbi:MAG: hypothetical protein EI684_19800 [Candidatus Viridilinea halotolerans]|uniref:FtsH ternary system domain-containing protein n=1 Tax=Candidatus Viridilinea halotolerans TaxID=2491704 RepID=A0A426TSH0_9CHLR|nr:MAG: hypothetical protein EI684_19800 [Candidatus Viridilinea halotolerans]